MKLNLRDFKIMRKNDNKLTWVTCYDYSFASALNETEIDLILVGDSGGMVALGYIDTVPVSMNEMILMCAAVRRGAPDKFIVGDMPKGSYEVSNEFAVENAMRFVKESGVDAVKLEGGQNLVDRVKAIVSSGIAVIGHIGLTPQSSTSLGGYRVVGRSKKEFEILCQDALSLELAGAFSILLEAIPPNSAKKITEICNIPIFGIGAGLHVNGQLLILHDLLGLYPKFRPKFAKNFIPEVIVEFQKFLSVQDNLLEFGRSTRRDGLFELTKFAVNRFVDEVRNGKFPSTNYVYPDQQNL